MVEVADPNILNILAAVPYCNAPLFTALEKYKDQVRFVLDSGAFTAWKAGKTVDIDTYCKFIDEMPVKPWRYFLLDVVGDPAATVKNYEIMLRRGYNPIPVFTRGEDPSVIDDFYKTSEVVGIGGLVQTKGNRGFVNGIMRHIGKRKVHWLGFTKPEYVIHYKPYMCDSSSWVAPMKYGRIPLYLGNGKFVVALRKDFYVNPSKEITDAIHTYGLDPNLFKHKVNWVNSGKHRNPIEWLAFRSALWANRELEALTGSKVFFAVACDWQMLSLLTELPFVRSVKPSLFAPKP
jgi:hypothetical protein